MNKKTLIRKIDLTLKQYGIDLKKLFKAIFRSNKDWVKSNFEEFIRQKSDNHLFEIYPNIPVYHDKLIESTDSISCLHALKHFGLGRYGDEIDYWGYLKGFNHIQE